MSGKQQALGSGTGASHPGIINGAIGQGGAAITGCPVIYQPTVKRTINQMPALVKILVAGDSCKKTFDDAALTTFMLANVPFCIAFLDLLDDYAS